MAVRGEDMTEEEAKTKWCPMSRVSAYPHTGGDKISLFANRDICFLVPGNSYDPATDITKCIASECMLWRWELTREQAENGYHPTDGFCGLGGRP